MDLLVYCLPRIASRTRRLPPKSPQVKPHDPQLSHQLTQCLAVFLKMMMMMMMMTTGAVQSRRDPGSTPTEGAISDHFLCLVLLIVVGRNACDLRKKKKGRKETRYLLEGKQKKIRNYFFYAPLLGVSLYIACMSLLMYFKCA
eukprot:Rmarinus@m.7180